MEGITNVEIIDFLEKCKKLKLFKGVFSKNTIPNYISKLCEFSIICNLSNNDEQGTHFITIIYKNKCLLFLDPLKLDMKNLFSDFFSNLNISKLLTLNYPIQDMLTDTCGIYCIFFVLLFDQHLPILNLQKFNALHLKLNDSICEKNIQLLKKELQ